MARASTERTKQRILRVAAELFAKNGYHATGIMEISEAVQLGKGALYYHISSKEDVLFEISRIYVEQLVNGGEQLLRKDLDPEAKFRRMSRQLMQGIVDHLPEWTVFNRDYQALTGHRRKIVMELRDRYEQIWGEIMQEGVDAGVFKAFDPIMVKAVIGLHNYSYIWVDPKGRLDPERLADLYCDFSLEGLRTADRGASREGVTQPASSTSSR